MAVVLRCQRLGRRNRSFFRVIAADERAKSDGRFVEILGTYDPLFPDETKQLVLKADRVQYWIGVGAQISETVRSLLVRAGIPLPVRKRRERTRPTGKPGRGGVKRKPARFKMTKNQKKKAASTTPAAAEPKAE